MTFVKTLWEFRKSLVVIIAPLILLPLPIIGQSKVALCGYVICLVGIYWATEACPLPVTSLIPVVLFPLFGIQSADAVSMNYMKHICFLLIGSIVVCLAIEEWNLHKRFALRILLIFGSNPRWIMLGLMCITAFLSMWLSNTSTVSLMLPVTIAVCREMETASRMEKDKSQQGKVHEESTQNAADNTDLEQEQFIEAEYRDDAECSLKTQSLGDVTERNNSLSLEKALTIAVTYSSTLGGISTTVGTPSNFVCLGIFGTMFGEDVTEVNFVSWFAFCFPISVICIFITWLWIQIRFLGIRNLCKSRDKSSSERVHTLLRGLYDELPPMKFAEKATIIHFVALILLWFFRDPKLFSGWKDLFPGGYAKDSTASIIIGISVLLFPSKSSSITWIWTRKSLRSSGPSPSLLDWKTFQQKFPWDVMLLLGAGFAIAGGCVDSGLSIWTGEKLLVLTSAPTWVVTLTVSIAVSILTEFASNVATASILLPIMLIMARTMGINPIIMLLASTLSCSFAFSLPIATPPNALAFSYKTLTVRDMLSTGIPLNFICVGILNIFLHLTGVPIFGLDKVPEWAMKNATALAGSATHP